MTENKTERQEARTRISNPNAPLRGGLIAVSAGMCIAALLLAGCSSAQGEPVTTPIIIPPSTTATPTSIPLPTVTEASQTTELSLLPAETEEIVRETLNSFSLLEQQWPILSQIAFHGAREGAYTSTKGDTIAFELVPGQTEEYGMIGPIEASIREGSLFLRIHIDFDIPYLESEEELKGLVEPEIVEEVRSAFNDSNALHEGIHVLHWLEVFSQIQSLVDIDSLGSDQEIELLNQLPTYFYLSTYGELDLTSQLIELLYLKTRLKTLEMETIITTATSDDGQVFIVPCYYLSKDIPLRYGSSSEIFIEKYLSTNPDEINLNLSEPFAMTLSRLAAIGTVDALPHLAITRQAIGKHSGLGAISGHDFILYIDDLNN